MFAQETEADVRRQWRALADQLRAKFPKIAQLMHEAEVDALGFTAFPKAHRLRIHCTKPLVRLNAEVKRRTDAVGIFPNEAAITRLAGAPLRECSGPRMAAAGQAHRRPCRHSSRAPGPCAGGWLFRGANGVTDFADPVAAE